MDFHRHFALGLAATAIACGTAAGVPSSKPMGNTQQPLEALVPLQGCGEVEAYLRERLTADVNRYVDQMVEQIEQLDRSEGAGGSSGNLSNDAPRPSPDARAR